MKNKTQSFVETLAELKNKNLVQYDSEEKISEYLDTQIFQSKNVGQFVFYILGAIFSLAGVLLFIAHNWDSFSDPVRLVLGFIPLIIYAVLGIKYFIKKSPAIFWKEVIPLIGITGVITSIAVVSQVYSMGGTLGDFLFVVICLTFLLPFIFNSGLAVIAILALLWGLSFELGFNNCSCESILECRDFFVSILLAVLVAYLFCSYKHTKIDACKSVAIYLSLIFAPAILISSLNLAIWDRYIPAILGLIFSIYMLVAVKNQKQENSLGFGILASIFLILLLAIYSPFAEIRNSIFPRGTSLEKVSLIYLGVLFLYYLYLLITAFKNKNISKAYLYLGLFPALYVFMIAILSYMSTPKDFYSADFTLRSVLELFCVSVGVVFIVSGMKRLSRGLLNLGVLALMTYAIVKFFSHEYLLLTRAIIFISSGIGFIVLNKVLNARKERAE